jgi:hypothetical protein
VKFTSTAGYQYFLGNMGDHAGYDISIYGDGRVHGWVANSGAYSPADGATTISTSVWHHVAIVVDGTALYLYLDGVQDGIRTNVDWTYNTVDRLRMGDGTNSNGSGYYLLGKPR